MENDEFLYDAVNGKLAEKSIKIRSWGRFWSFTLKAIGSFSMPVALYSKCWLHINMHVVHGPWRLWQGLPSLKECQHPFRVAVQWTKKKQLLLLHLRRSQSLCQWLQHSATLRCDASLCHRTMHFCFAFSFRYPGPFAVIFVFPVFTTHVYELLLVLFACISILLRITDERAQASQGNRSRQKTEKYYKTKEKNGREKNFHLIFYCIFHSFNEIWIPLWYILIWRRCECCDVVAMKWGFLLPSFTDSHWTISYVVSIRIVIF